MFPRVCLITVLFLALQGFSPAGMALAPTGSADWYYRMGGASPSFNLGAGYDHHKAQFEGSYSWQMDACGFNIRDSVRTQLNNMRENLYQLEESVVNSARAVLRISALSVLQRANPGLYDLLTRGLISARADVEAAVKNCNRIQEDMDAGRNPLQGWINIAMHAQWSHARLSGQDPVAVQRDLAEQSARKGIAWVGGVQAGGEGQPPIRVTADVVAAGYSRWGTMSSDMQREEEAAGPEGTVRLEQIWTDSAQASAWAAAVLGETEIRLCTGCKALVSRAGEGLHGEIYRMRKQAHQRIAALLANNERPTAAALQELGNPAMGLALHVGVIQGLREESPANRAILSERLAAEIALATALEKSLALRHLLRIGRREPNVLSNSEAAHETSRLLQQLDEEIENILFEQQVRREALSSGAYLILERRRLRQMSGLLPDAVQPPSTPLPMIEGGAVSAPAAQE